MRIRIEYEGHVYDKEIPDEIARTFGVGLGTAIDDGLMDNIPGSRVPEAALASEFAHEVWLLLVCKKLPQIEPQEGT